MCGIVGYIDFSGKPIKLETFDKMTDLLVHRGPDDRGVEIFRDVPFVALGHRRLAIVDLSSAGHQPMANEDGSIWIVYNGEIYNYRDLKKELESKGHVFRSNTDTEVIIHAYEEWGKECLHQFNGMFAFAIWDEKSRTLFAARDRLGIKPLYYCQKWSIFVFASEIKSILISHVIQSAPDWEVLHTPSRFQISPRTGFDSVFKLLPGHFMTISDGKIDIECYWDIEPREEAIDEEKAIQTLYELLEDSVRLQMIADVPVGAFLSGGLDSSTIVVLMQKMTNFPVRTFTITFREQDQHFESMPDDSRYAREIAHHFHCQHREIEIEPDISELLPKMIWHLDEPLADAAAINTFLISQAAREEGVIVLLNGMGGDEVFGGYRKQLACLLAEKYQQLLSQRLRQFIELAFQYIPVGSRQRGFRTIRWVKRFLSFASLPQAERFLVSDLSLSHENYMRLFTSAREYPYSQSPHVIKSLSYLNQEGLSYVTRMCLTDTKIFLPEHNLTYSDKATMAASIEGRPPLIDHRIVEFLFRLPPQYRINGKTQKYLLKKTMEPFLPTHIIYRPKAPFGSPLRSWIRGPLTEMIDDLLSPTALKKRGLYKSEEVWRLIREDREGKEDNSSLIWTMLTIELWFQIFIDR
ncbi:asparagine synthase (glutamine-hydrolyzing) [Candidatus Poribacteria bacterium]|nr:asparagine synthase (glutamine-hydrolyzing) [Candidatus Poribacteria bacterium]